MKFKIGDLILILVALALTIGGFIYIYFPRHYDTTNIARVELNNEVVMDIDFLNLTEEIKDDSLAIKVENDILKHEKEYVIPGLVSEVKLVANKEGITALEYNLSGDEFIKSETISKLGEKINCPLNNVNIEIVPLEEEKPLESKYLARVEFNKKIILEIDFVKLTEDIKDSSINIEIEYNREKEEKYYTFRALMSEITICANRNGVYVKESGCPDHICIKTGTINIPGRPIACMPNKVLITIIDPEGALS